MEAAIVDGSAHYPNGVGNVPRRARGVVRFSAGCLQSALSRAIMAIAERGAHAGVPLFLLVAPVALIARQKKAASWQLTAGGLPSKGSVSMTSSVYHFFGQSAAITRHASHTG